MRVWLGGKGRKQTKAREEGKQDPKREMWGGSMPVPPSKSTCHLQTGKPDFSSFGRLQDSSESATVM